eukprot:TRINITY_DN10901_c3_g2_i1.p1 TRINITY_DN10901_c3_g2~~TRINITY_DN10901_c3_g2_i1.p1  ORF type:complete len:275 (+),score=71.27 TRINITY_DN10901_c3_g2_i1:97-921(+)
MYAESGLFFPYFQSFSQDVQHLEEFCSLQRTNARSNLLQTSTMLEYDLGGEGDLFKAPELIMEEPVLGLDPMAAISMISGNDDVIPDQTVQGDHLLSEVFYECKKDLLAKSAIEESISEVSDAKIPAAKEDSVPEKDGLILEGLMQKSVSSGCLSSMEWINGGAMRPSFLDFHQMDLRGAFGMRRAFSEGDIQTLGNGNINLIHSPFERPPVIIGNYTSEERMQRLSRYRNKKTKRNFGRKIKYACRKALADNQPRFRGRFAKTEESEVMKPSK